MRDGGVDELRGGTQRATPSGGERVGRPDADRPFVERRVGGVVGGRLRPVHDLAGPGLACRPRGGQQRRRSARLHPVAPPAAGADEQVAGAGDRDVAEPDLLGQPEVLPFLDVDLQRRLDDGLVARARHGEPQLGQLRTVGQAQVGGDGTRVLHPGVAGVGLGRELVRRHPRHGHDVPLEALRRVPGEQLDRLRVDRDLPRLQPALALLGVAQVAQERGQGRQLRELGELRGDAVQGVEVGPCTRRADARGAGQLRLQAQRAGDLVDQVRQRLPQPVTQVPQLGTEPPQPPVSGGGVRVRSPEVVERLDDAAALGRRLDDGRLARGSRVGRTPGVDEGTGPGLQRGEVARPDPPPGAGQQPAQGVAGGRVDEHGERGDDVGDLGHLQQPAEADDLDRDVAPAQGCGDARQLLAGADEHRRRRRATVRASAELRVGAVPAGREPLGERLRLLGDGLVEADRDRAAPRGGCGCEVGQRLLRRRKHRRDGVGHGQDRLVVAPAGREREPLGAAVPDGRGRCGRTARSCRPRRRASRRSTGGGHRRRAPDGRCPARRAPRASATDRHWCPGTRRGARPASGPAPGDPPRVRRPRSSRRRRPGRRSRSPRRRACGPRTPRPGAAAPPGPAAGSSISMTAAYGPFLRGRVRRNRRSAPRAPPSRRAVRRG